MSESKYQIQFLDRMESDIWVNRNNSEFPFDEVGKNRAIETLNDLKEMVDGFGRKPIEFRLILITIEIIILTET